MEPILYESSRIITWIIFGFIIFRKKIMRLVGLEHDRARNLFSSILILFALLMAAFFLDPSNSSEDRMRRMFGLLAGVPAGFLSDRFYIFRNIKGNTLYLCHSRRSLCISIPVGLIMGYWAASTSNSRELIDFMTGVLSTSSMVTVYHIVKFERAQGPLYIKNEKPEK